MKSIRFITALVLAGTVALGASGCSNTEAIDMAKVTSVIDVRSADEFNSGHLEGAINMDVESANFSSQIATLDKSGKYLIYCHSGRRAGIAVDQMSSSGFTDVTNIGGISDAAATTSLTIIN